MVHVNNRNLTPPGVGAALRSEPCRAVRREGVRRRAAIHHRLVVGAGPRDVHGVAVAREGSLRPGAEFERGRVAERIRDAFAFFALVRAGAGG
jgi:hypothetical protein